MQEQILAALKKLGPSSPGAVANELGTGASSMSYHLRQLLAAKSIKATGTSNDRCLALPDQEFPERGNGSKRTAPPKKHGKKAKHAKRTSAPARRATPSTERFIASVDAERRLVLLNGTGEPLVFTDDQTEAIATVLFIHYDKA